MKKLTHPNSYIVTLRSVPPYNFNPKDPEVKVWLDQLKISVGSYYNSSGRGSGTGLSEEEMKVLLPRVINVAYNDLSFRSEVNKYYASFVTRIPSGGLPLEIGLQHDNEKPVTLLAKIKGSEEMEYINLPINIEQYLAYRHAIGHPFTRMSEEEALSDPTAHYYIDDPMDKTVKKNKEIEIADRAYSKYLDVKKDIKTVNMVLTLLGKKVKDIDKDNRIPVLKELMEKDPKTFTEISSDPQLAMKYEISQMVSRNILTAHGNSPRYVITESGTEIAVGIDDLIGWMKDKANSEDVGLLKSKLQASLKG